MREPSTAVFFFCAGLGRDPVALHVFAAMERELGLTGTAVEVDGYEVMLHSAPEGDRCLLVRLDDVLSYDYRRYPR
jgi:hypothetical protein